MPMGSAALAGLAGGDVDPTDPIIIVPLGQVPPPATPWNGPMTEARAESRQATRIGHVAVRSHTIRKRLKVRDHGKKP